MDWDISYRTIDDRVQAISQLAFLRNLARGEAYQAEAPALWDVTFGTAVAQAEIEDRETPGTFIRLAFALRTARAEREFRRRPTGRGRRGDDQARAAACLRGAGGPSRRRAVRALFGSTATTPLFGVQVPILAHRLADPAKGTGLVMVCTFGDMTDVTWWRDLQLDTRPVIGKDGRLLASPPPGITSEAGVGCLRAHRRPVREGRPAARDRPAARGRTLRGEPEPVRHAVKFYEYGQAPLEIITTRQWYIRNGSRSTDLADALLAGGRELQWHPEYMRTRYEHWVEGLTGDWLISRQRYRGVPIPVWYPLDATGQLEQDEPIVPAEADLPVDPAADTPAGFRPEQRGQPGGFAADPDVMDTWATSSLTPQIAAGWPADEDLLGRVFPMDLRPQAHEIIRTWLFYTVLRSHDEAGVLPWRHAAISGWILDPDRKKMSKSKGNAVTPMDLLREHGTDAVRYWAASARLGVDTAFDLAQIKIGRRLAIKILNAAGSCSASTPVARRRASAICHGPVRRDRDRRADRPGAGARLADVVERCTTALEDYDHATALEQAERFFWFFCDDYLELVKARAYGEHGQAAAASAVATLRTGLSVVLRLLAPFLPFVTEEVWSWWQDGSVHRARWPEAAELTRGGGSGRRHRARGRASADRRDQEGEVAGTGADEEPDPAAHPDGRAGAPRRAAAAGQDVQAAGDVDKIELRGDDGNGASPRGGDVVSRRARRPPPGQTVFGSGTRTFCPLRRLASDRIAKWPGHSRRGVRVSAPSSIARYLGGQRWRVMPSLRMTDAAAGPAPGSGHNRHHG